MRCSMCGSNCPPLTSFAWLAACERCDVIIDARGSGDIWASHIPSGTKVVYSGARGDSARTIGNVQPIIPQRKRVRNPNPRMKVQRRDHTYDPEQDVA